MAIPKHDAIRVPALKLLQNQGTMELKDFEQPLAALNEKACKLRSQIVTSSLVTPAQVRYGGIRYFYWAGYHGTAAGFGNPFSNSPAELTDKS